MAIKIYGGGPNPAVSLDPFRTIVNVHWPSDEGEYIAVRYATFPNYGVTSGGGSCATAVKVYSTGESWTETYLSSVAYNPGIHTVYVRDVSTGIWNEGPFGWFPDGIVEVNDPGIFVTHPLPAETYVGGFRYRHGYLETRVNSRGIPKWQVVGGTATTVPVPNHPEVFGDGLAASIAIASDLINGPFQCSDIGTGLPTGPIQLAPANGKVIATADEPYDVTEVPHTPQDLDFTVMKLVETLEDESTIDWLPVATKLVGQNDADATSPTNGTTGELYVLFQRQTPPTS